MKKLQNINKKSTETSLYFRFRFKRMFHDPSLDFFVLLIGLSCLAVMPGRHIPISCPSEASVISLRSSSSLDILERIDLFFRVD